MVYSISKLADRRKRRVININGLDLEEMMDNQLISLQLEKPKQVIKAQEAQKGMNWFLEILVFLAVFIVSSIGQVFCMLPGEVILLAMNEDYRAAVAANDLEAATLAAEQIGGSDLYMVFTLFATIGMTLVTILFCKLIQKRKIDTLGFTKGEAGREYLIGLGVGFVLFSSAILICVLTGALKIEGFSETFGVGMFMLFVLGYMLQGMSEEVLCRGYLMVSIGRRYPMWVAVLSNAVIFAALHLLNNGISILAFINLVLFGVFASLYYLKRGSIWGIAALHSIWNLVQGNFWGLRVSGIITECSVLRSTMIDGKEIFNGGAFGPEGGLGVSVVLLVGICVLLRKKKNEAV